MDRVTFGKLLESEYAEIRQLNDTKGVEYSGSADVLSDFRAVAQAVGITQEQALITYATKHWRAINSHAQSGVTLSEGIEGRIRDLQLYLSLYLAMVKDAEPYGPPTGKIDTSEWGDHQ